MAILCCQPYTLHQKNNGLLEGHQGDFDTWGGKGILFVELGKNPILAPKKGSQDRVFLHIVEGENVPSNIRPPSSGGPGAMDVTAIFHRTKAMPKKLEWSECACFPTWNNAVKDGRHARSE